MVFISEKRSFVLRKRLWLNIGRFILMSFVVASSAYASLFQVKSQYGFNEGQVGQGGFSKYNSKEVRLSAHQFILDYPLSFGFSLGREIVNSSSAAFSRSSALRRSVQQAPNYIHNDELAIEVQAWLPDSMTGGWLRPFVKSGHTLWSNYKLKAKLLENNKKEAYSEGGVEQGFSLSIGSQINVSPDYSAVLEMRYQAKSILANDTGVEYKRNLRAGGALLGFAMII